MFSNKTITFNRISIILGHWVNAFDSRVETSIRNLAENGRIVFNTVVSNQGFIYNASIGIFTSPSGGVYVFDWTILAFPGSDAHTALTASFGHEITAILERPVFCNLVAKWRY